MKIVFETRVSDGEHQKIVSIVRLRRMFFWCLTRWYIPMPYRRVHMVVFRGEVKVTPLPILGSALRYYTFPESMAGQAWKELGWKR